MPTTKKTLMFLASFFTSFGSFVVICAILGNREWITSIVAISDSSSNGSIAINYGLFHGHSTQELNHGLAEPDKDFEGK